MDLTVKLTRELYVECRNSIYKDMANNSHGM